jgi:hypothetical protein
MLPERYWHGMHRGALLSILLTAGLGIRVGYAGFYQYARVAAEENARLALAMAGPGGGVAGIDRTTAVAAALQGSILVPFAFFLFTPIGWIADYLFISAVYRAFALAIDHPKGDPLLTVLDNVVHDLVGRCSLLLESLGAARLASLLSGDHVIACRGFAGSDADFLVVAGRRKLAWTLGTTVVAQSIRLRVGEPREVVVAGWRRMCYPLRVIRDVQVDRRIVHYRWPEDAPPLPWIEAETEG